MRVAIFGRNFFARFHIRFEIVLCRGMSWATLHAKRLWSSLECFVFRYMPKMAVVLLVRLAAARLARLAVALLARLAALLVRLLLLRV
jgi:hypothetical protein